jgi:hypothetical protein
MRFCHAVLLAALVITPVCAKRIKVSDKWGAVDSLLSAVDAAAVCAPAAAAAMAAYCADLRFLGVEARARAEGLTVIPRMVDQVQHFDVCSVVNNR